MPDAPVAATLTIRCASCGVDKPAKAGKGGAKLPRGWKRHEQVYCGRCWQDRYVLRAVTIPVVRPLGEGIGWQELRVALAEAWSLSTSATNWITSQLWARDEHRMPGQEKLGKQPTTYLYPETRQRFPALPSQTCAAMENSAKGRYGNKRYEAVWTCSASIPSARYPQPYVTPNQSWRAAMAPAGKDGGDLVPCVSVTLPGGRFLLQLRGGKEFARQLADVRQIISGSAVQGELAILRRRADKSRNGVSGRDSGGQKAFHRVMVKMVAWFPRKPRSERSGTLFVRFDPECFAIALDEQDEKLRVWNADHVRRWIAEHRRRLDRWSDDQKAEQRPVASFQSRRESAVEKFRRRIKSFIQETSAQIVGVARRRRLAEIKVDDTCRSYFGEGRFDYSGFRVALANACNADNITVTFASGAVAQKTPEPLAETEGEV